MCDNSSCFTSCQRINVTKFQCVIETLDFSLCFDASLIITWTITWQIVFIGLIATYVQKEPTTIYLILVESIVNPKITQNENKFNFDFISVAKLHILLPIKEALTFDGLYTLHI